MKITLKNVKVTSHIDKKPEWISPVISSNVYTSEEIGYPIGFGLKYKRQLFVELGVDFWSNDTQLEKSTKLAMSVLAERLYGDVRSLINEIKLAAMNHDEKQILMLCNEIEKITSVE